MQDNGEQILEREIPEIIPDFENEIVDDYPQEKKKGCGCKGKNQMSVETAKPNYWLIGGMAILSLVVLYMLFNKKGSATAEITN
jgi:hypothetical protein